MGQLACDVLISSLNARRVGFLYDDSVVPVVGSEPFVLLDDSQQQHVTTAVEGTVCHFINVAGFFDFPAMFCSDYSNVNIMLVLLLLLVAISIINRETQCRVFSPNLNARFFGFGKYVPVI